MGWSCTAAVSDTLRKLTDACVAQTGHQNVFREDGVLYMWEHQHEDTPDGHIAGEVFRMRGSMEGDLAAGGLGVDKRVGGFRVDPDGTLTGHGLLTRLLKPTKPGRNAR